MAGVHTRRTGRSILLGALLALLAVASVLTPAASAAPEPPPSTSAPAAGGALDEPPPLPTEGAVSGALDRALTRPTLTIPGAVSTPLSVRPPLLSPLSNPIIKRDCGFSVELTGGDALWVFCDSSNKTEDGKFTYIRNSTAAVAHPDSPTITREASDSSGRPYPFIVPDPDHNPCVGANAGDLHVIWPLSATRVPGPWGRDRVLVYFVNYCYERFSGSINGYDPVSVGLAAWDHDPDGPPAEASPIQATILVPELWDVPTSPGPFGEAAVYGTDGFVYVYRCQPLWGCQVARVHPYLATDAASYRYWNGLGWWTEPPAGATVDLGGGIVPPGLMNVVYLDEWGLYGMADMAFPSAYQTDVRVRVAPTPMGPWSLPAAITNPTDCRNELGCYAGYLHSQLSDVDHLGVSVFDWHHYFFRGGQVRAWDAVAAVSPPPAGVCHSGFSDVLDAHPFCTEIAWFAREGITTGWPDGTFRPLRNTSRQAMAAWFYRYAGAPPGPFPDPGFSDVEPGDEFYDEIAWFAQQDITTGFPDGTFRPTWPISRQAIAAFFHRAAGDEPGPFPDPGFSDVPPDHPFYEDIAWFAQQGITTGYPDGTYRPAYRLTRQAIAAFFYRDAGN